MWRQRERVQSVRSSQPRARRRHDTQYLLRGRVLSAVCGRRMTGAVRGTDRRYYGCELRRGRPGANLEHPVDVYVREDALIDALDDWLDELFALDRATATSQLIVDAAAHDPARQARVDQAQRTLSDARRRLSQHRAALDGGADAGAVTEWITEAAADERAAVAELDHLASEEPAALTSAEAFAVVNRFGGMPGLLQQSDQAERAALYAALGASAPYDPASRTAELAVAIPRGAKNVSEDRLLRYAHLLFC